MRIGQGYDVHAFTSGDGIVLGGVPIAHDQAIDAHSDGDVLLHALCDALLGAAALGDIGQHFPPDQAQYLDISSRHLLRHVFLLLEQQGYRVGNVDCTVIAQRPHLAVYIPDMRTNIAADLMIQMEQVSIKATTTEKLGFEGREQGIAATAVALLLSS